MFTVPEFQDLYIYKYKNMLHMYIYFPSHPQPQRYHTAKAS